MLHRPIYGYQAIPSDTKRYQVIPSDTKRCLHGKLQSKLRYLICHSSAMLVAYKDYAYWSCLKISVKNSCRFDICKCSTFTFTPIFFNLCW